MQGLCGFRFCVDLRGNYYKPVVGCKDVGRGIPERSATHRHTLVSFFMHTVGYNTATESLVRVFVRSLDSCKEYPGAGVMFSRSTTAMLNVQVILGVVIMREGMLHGPELAARFRTGSKRKEELQHLERNSNVNVKIC